MLVQCVFWKTNLCQVAQESVNGHLVDLYVLVLILSQHASAYQ